MGTILGSISSALSPFPRVFSVPTYGILQPHPQSVFPLSLSVSIPLSIMYNSLSLLQEKFLVCKRSPQLNIKTLVLGISGGERP